MFSDSSSRQLQLTPEEQAWQKRLKKMAERAFMRNRPEQLPFLTPREQLIARASLGDECTFDGGFVQAQRQRAVIGSDEPATILLLEATYANRFYTIGHRDVLGALMSLGVDREQFGDIRIDEQRIQIACTQTIAPYLMQQLKQIGKVPVDFQPIERSEALPNQEQCSESEIIVASLRLDGIIAEIRNCSRKQAQQMIQAQLVQCNYQVMTKNDFVCQVGDLLSIRQFGRVYLKALRKQTRKGNTVLVIEQYQDRR